MKKLNDQVIIYDDACPMCTAYTGTFIHLGWLSQRIPFSQIDKELLNAIDIDRGRHEIPLYNPKNGTTIYGLDALLLIIGNRLPFLRPLFRQPIFRRFWKQIYWIITYNRRIIAGSPTPLNGMDCAPDRHVGYRWMYILLMIAWTFMLTAGTFALQLALPAGQALAGLLSLSLIGGLLLKKDRLSWLGHWVTVLFIDAVLLQLLPVSGIAILSTLLLSTFLLWKRWKLR